MRWMRWVMVLLWAGAAVAAPMPDPAQYQWKARVLLLFAPGPSDPALVAQRDAVAVAEGGMRERDLVLLTNIGGDGALRRRYGVGGDGFAALLIGKDGGVKLRSDRPIPVGELFGTVDAMPMRREEAGRR